MHDAPLAKHLSQTSDLAGLPSTNFERPRGQVEVEITAGVTQVHLAGMAEPLPESRLAALRAMARAGVSIDFLKFTPSGFSFVCQDDDAPAVAESLRGLAQQIELQPDRCIASVQAANMRAEEGMIALIISQLAAIEAPILHLSDMHDRLLAVTDSAGARLISEELPGRIREAGA